MQRWTDLGQVPADFGPSVVTWGNFDGVHTGHRAVLNRVVERARGGGAAAVAITFDPHPSQVLHPDRAPQLITSVPQRLALLEALDVDAVLVLRFTTELAGQSPERFVEQVLVRALGARTVVVGQDTRFGHRNRGDVNTLRELGGRLGFDVVVLDDLAPSVSSGGSTTRGRRWSSSWIREQVIAGDVEAAAAALSRPHRVGGVVVHGDHRGRELGYPTANLQPRPEGLVPADGVYAGWLLRPEVPEPAPDRLLPAAISIGTNPTFTGDSSQAPRRVEAHVLDRIDLDLYGEFVVVEMVRRLRSMVRFDDVRQLVAQMGRDIEQCRSVLGAVVPRAQDRGPTA
ncbi:MAG: bifunctional riboflavin kinase/FAD synthetase [Angustibacter sp.]